MVWGIHRMAFLGRREPPGRIVAVQLDHSARAGAVEDSTQRRCIDCPPTPTHSPLPKPQSSATITTPPQSVVSSFRKSRWIIRDWLVVPTPRMRTATAQIKIYFIRVLARVSFGAVP